MMCHVTYPVDCNRLVYMWHVYRLERLFDVCALLDTIVWRTAGVIVLVHLCFVNYYLAENTA